MVAHSVRKTARGVFRKAASTKRNVWGGVALLGIPFSLSGYLVTSLAFPPTPVQTEIVAAVDRLANVSMQLCDQQFAVDTGTDLRTSITALSERQTDFAQSGVRCPGANMRSAPHGRWLL